MNNSPKTIFENPDWLVIDKPAGLVVHGGSGVHLPTLEDWLKHKFPHSPLHQQRFGIVHRLDKDTSGVMIVAKTEASMKWLQHAFKHRLIEKEYLALVHGRLQPEKGVIQVPIGRDLVRRTKFAPSQSGRLAETKYQIEKYFSKFTYLKAWPKTGRTHQIRVHFAALGHPIVGDRTYGRADNLSRQFLHAHRLTVADQTGKSHVFVAPLAEDLKQYLQDVK